MIFIVNVSGFFLRWLKNAENSPENVMHLQFRNEIFF